MPVSSWTTPSLATVRAQNRAYIEGRLGVPLIPNDVPRVLADANGGNAHLNLQYLDWQANQLLPDTAQKQFLDKWATIYLVNADGSRGRKSATYANGTATITASVAGTSLPAGSLLTAQSGSSTLTFQVTAATTIALAATSFPIRALNAGAASNLDAGTTLTLAVAVPGINNTPVVVTALTGGADQETDDELRVRLLARIRQPPMGGDADDYVSWALEVAGVTRAWCSPNEMGPGTVTLRFMCDDLRATSDPTTNGFPSAADVAAVQAYVDTVRPVTVKDFFVFSPVPLPINVTVASLSPNNVATQQAVTTSIAAMLARRAAPARAVNGIRIEAQTIWQAWMSEAVLAAPGVNYFDLEFTDQPMPYSANLAVPGVVTFV